MAWASADQTLTGPDRYDVFAQLKVIRDIYSSAPSTLANTVVSALNSFAPATLSAGEAVDPLLQECADLHSWAVTAWAQHLDPAILAGLRQAATETLGEESQTIAQQQLQGSTATPLGPLANAYGATSDVASTIAVVDSSAQKDFQEIRATELDPLDMRAATMHIVIGQAVMDAPIAPDVSGSAQDLTKQSPNLDTALQALGAASPGTGDLVITTDASGDQSVPVSTDGVGVGTVLANTQHQTYDVLGVLDQAMQQMTQVSDMADNSGNQADAQHDRATAESAAKALNEVAGDKGTVTLLGAILGPIDPTLATEVTTVAEAGLQDAKAISNMISTIASLALDATPTGLLSLASSTGTIVSTVESLANMWMGGPHTPTPDEQILTGIHELSKQIAQLGTVMNKQFERVDKGLDMVYSALSTDFSRLSEQIQNVEYNVQQTGENVLALRQSLDTLSQDIFQLAQSQDRSAIYSAIDQSVNYTINHPQAGPLPEEKFREAETAFSHYALFQAREDRQLSQPAGRCAVSSEQIAEALETQAVEDDVNCLAEYAAYHFDIAGLIGRNPETEPLANPFDWALGARAYMALDAQWPGYSEKDINPVTGEDAVLNELIESGQQIASHLRAIGLNKELFPKLLAEYKNELPNVENTVRGYFKSAVTKASFPEHILWASPTQTLTGEDLTDTEDRISGINIAPWVPEAEKIAEEKNGKLSDNQQVLPACDNKEFEAAKWNGGELAPFDWINKGAIPLTLSQLFAPQVLTAIRLRLGEGSVCYKANWAIPVPAFPAGETKSAVTVEIQGRYAEEKAKIWETLRRFVFTTTPIIQCRVTKVKGFPETTHCGDAENAVSSISSTNTVAFGAVQSSTEDAPNEEALTRAVAQRLEVLRGGVYREVKKEIESSSDAAGRALGGDQTLIADYLELGLPQALSSDVLLHSLIAGPALSVSTPTAGVPSGINTDGSLAGCQHNSASSCGDLAAWFGQAIPNANSPRPPSEVLERFKTVLEMRLAELQSKIAGYQRLASQSPTSLALARNASTTAAYQDTDPVIASVLNDLELEQLVLATTQSTEPGLGPGSGAGSSNPSPGGKRTEGSGPIVHAITSTNISTAQILALLSQELAPTDKAAKVATLIKASGFTVSFKALEAGTAIIDWYEVPRGAKLAKRTKATPILVAAGHMAFSAAGTTRIKVRLTAAGKRLLENILIKGAKSLKLIAKGTFTPAGKTPITTTRTFTLKR